MSIRPDRYSCQSWNVAAKVILKSFARGHSEELSEDIQEETETAKETVSESEVFVTALNDTSTALETCLEDLSDHSVSEIATISDTLVNTDDDSSLTKVLDSDSSRTVKIQDSSASDTLMASEHKQNLQSQLLSAEEPTNHATLPKAILDMCDKATDKLRNSLLFENISGDLQCASDVERLNKIIHEKENYSSPTNITVQQMATKRRIFLDSSSSSILVNDSSLTNTLLVTPSLQISKTKTLDKTKSVLSETVNKNSRMNRNNDFSSSETLCIDESLSKTLVDDQEVLDSTIVDEEQEVSSVSQTILAESHKNSKKEKSKEDSSFDKTLDKIDSSSLATILADNSSLTNTLLVTPCSSITKTKNKSQPILSQPVFKKDRKNRYTELCSSDTLCIDESLSEQSLSPSILDKKQGVSSVLKTVLSENNRTFKQQISRLDESREHTLQDISIYGDEKTDTSLSETMLLENTLTDQSKDKTYHCQNSSSSVTLHGTDMLNINPKRNTNSASQESSCSKTLQLDTSVFDIAMDKSNNQEHYDKKIQFGKGPKSALFVKIKNRYEQSTSENEDFNQLLPYKDEARFSQNEKLKYLKETKLEDTECLDNQKKIPWAKETLASEIIETRENIGLKYKHSNVIGKLNSLYQSEIKTEKIQVKDIDEPNKSKLRHINNSACVGENDSDKHNNANIDDQTLPKKVKKIHRSDNTDEYRVRQRGCSLTHSARTPPMICVDKIEFEKK